MFFAMGMSKQFLLCGLGDSRYHCMECSILSALRQRNVGQDQHS